MKAVVCRDCGSALDPKGRGCSHCALNLEAEAMIERVVIRLILPIALISIVGVFTVMFLLLR